MAISQYLLGVRPDFEGLRVHPCLGGEVGKFTVTRKCRGAEYRIHVKNSGQSGSSGAPKLTVDASRSPGIWSPTPSPARPSSSTARSELDGRHRYGASSSTP